MKELKKVVAENLIYLRKSKKLTQQELAELFSYSDKTISKWELGYAVPSVEVLKSLANFYGVTLDFFVSENSIKEKKKYKRKIKNENNKYVITALSVTAVWLIAISIYVATLLSTDQTVNNWVSLVWAVPGSLFVAMILTRLWWNKSVGLFIFISLFIWAVLVAAYCSFLSLNLWYIFFIGIPIQIGVILFSQFK